MMNNVNVVLITILSLMIASGAASAETTISIAELAAVKEKNVTVPIIINNVSNFGTGTIELSYNSGVVRVVSYSSGNIVDADAPQVNIIDGRTRILVDYTKSLTGPSGTFNFINITLKGVGEPKTKSNLNISIEELKTPTGTDIPVIPINGSFKILLKGDVDGYDGITMADAMYIGKAVLNKPGFTLDTTTMNVDGIDGVTLDDALHLAKYVIGVPGFAI